MSLGASRPHEGVLADGEPIVSLASTPGQVGVTIADLDSLFEQDLPPAYPHRGPMLNRSVAKVLVDSTREQRRIPRVELVVSVRTPPDVPEREAATRAQMRSFFANEAELAALDLRVNRTEGLGSLRYALPLVLLAGLAAGALYTNLWTLGDADYLAALAYLIFITIVWVMLWDPLEKLLFDSYFLRLQIRALQKLEKAQITFRYDPATVPTARDARG